MKNIVLCSIFAFTLCGCTSVNNRALDAAQSQVAVRNYQTRSFDTADKDNILRNVVATMQDLGFVIDKADRDIGTVTGFSFTNKTTLTVTVRVTGEKTIVRANAQDGLKAIQEPQAYQNFFNALSQSLFLTANEVL